MTFCLPVMLAARGGNTILTEAQNGATVRVRVRAQITVRLEAQLGTGYGWQVDGLPSGLRAAGESQETPSGQPRVGGTDIQVFRFTASRKGRFHLRFAYRRPWDKASPPQRVFQTTIVVR